MWKIYIVIRPHIPNETRNRIFLVSFGICGLITIVLFLVSFGICGIITIDKQTLNLAVSL